MGIATHVDHGFTSPWYIKGRTSMYSFLWSITSMNCLCSFHIEDDRWHHLQELKTERNMKCTKTLSLKFDARNFGNALQRSGHNLTQCHITVMTVALNFFHSNGLLHPGRTGYGLTVGILNLQPLWRHKIWLPPSRWWSQPFVIYIF